jgi:hypothetical protein
MADETPAVTGVSEMAQKLMAACGGAMAVINCHGRCGVFGSSAVNKAVWDGRGTDPCMEGGA